MLYDMGWPQVMASFAEGTRLFGHTTEITDIENYAGPTPHDVIVTIEWGSNVERIHRDVHGQGRPTLAIHDAYIDRRGKGRYYSVARNCAHNYGDHIPLESAPGDRWKALGAKLKPWRGAGTHILVADQVEAQSVCGNGAVRPPWFTHVMEMLHRITERPVRFRTHHGQDDPEGRYEAYRKVWLDSGGPPDQLVHSQGNRSKFTDDLRDAWAVLTYDSTAAVEAVLNGIPVFTGGRSMADPVANKNLFDIERPAMVDRTQWAYWIAYAQWTEAEMRQGLPWRILIEAWRP